jgi:hypothetical protein
VRLPVPASEPVGWGMGYTDLNADTSFGSQATGWSHGVVAATGFGAAAPYTVALAAAARWAWRRGVPAGGQEPGQEPGPAIGAAAAAPAGQPPG